MKTINVRLRRLKRKIGLSTGGKEKEERVGKGREGICNREKDGKRQKEGRGKR